MILFDTRDAPAYCPGHPGEHDTVTCSSWADWARTHSCGLANCTTCRPVAAEQPEPDPEPEPEPVLPPAQHFGVCSDCETAVCRSCGACECFPCFPWCGAA